jgi:hypothetical protein
MNPSLVLKPDPKSDFVVVLPRLSEKSLPRTVADIMLSLGLGASEVLQAASLAVRDCLTASEKKAVLATDMLGLLRLQGAEYKAEIASLAGNSLGTAQVAELMGWTSRAAVNKSKKAGRLLAYSPPGEAGDRFPAWQFDGHRVRAWAPRLIASTGNGWPALHFLLKKRHSLKGGSYLDHLLAGDESIVEDMLAKAARIGDMEAAHG